MPIHLNDANLEDDLRLQLSELGYATVDAVMGATQAAPHHARRLGIDAVRLREGFDAFEAAPATEPTPRFSFGARLHNVPIVRHGFELVPPTLALPPSVNLISEMPPIRNQERRGTCVAFSTLAVVEHRLGKAGNPQDLSEQFQYYNCKRNDGDPMNPGSFLAVSYPLLVSDGCCLEATWPYNPDDIPGNEGQNPPPAGAATEAAGFRQSGFKALPANSVRAIQAELAKGNAVSFSIPVFNSWYQNPAVVRSGDLVMPFPQEPSVGGHAMCLVGYQDSTELGNPGGGRFLLRNSWGADWGTDNPNGAGYGSIPYDYIVHYAVEAYTLS